MKGSRWWARAVVATCVLACACDPTPLPPLPPRPKPPIDVKPDLRPVGKDLRRCYAAALNIDSDAEGRVVIHVEIAADGTVVSTEPQYRSGNLSDAVVACLARAFRPVRVEPPGAPTWFDAPVTFRKAN